MSSVEVYDLVCIEGEAEGDKVRIDQEQLAPVARFLRASLEWLIASASGSVNYKPHQPVFVEHIESASALIDAGIFQNKYQARSTWVLRDPEE